MDSNFSGGPGFAAFVVTAVLVIGVLLLARSLTRHLRKVRTHPPVEDQPKAASTGLEDGDGAGDVVADESGDR